MRSAPISVLFTHFGEQWIRGSEEILLGLITNLDPARVKPVVWCNGGELAAAVAARGIPVHRTDFQSFFTYNGPRFDPRRYWSFVREGVSLSERYGVNVLHANGAGANQWLVPVARITKRPLLTHLHIAYLRRERFMTLLHQSTLIVGVSKQVVGALSADGVSPDRVEIIYNGIDFARLTTLAETDLRRTLGIPEQALVIAAIGSLIPRKGFDVLIDAFGRLDAARDVRLVIAGEGPEKEALAARVRSAGLDARVVFLGYTREVPALYQACDIFALASRNDSFGLVLAEAGYFSRPVVSTRVGGIPEVVDDGRTGLLVPPDDPAALAGALATLVADRDYRRALGAAARQKVESSFSLAQMVAHFEDAYERLARIPPGKLGWKFGTLLEPACYLRLLRGHKH
jgi:glycosyltransferase involved in cell wall biosynthesis